MGLLGHPSRRRESGFTLVEVMVAISILLVGVLGVVGTVDVANRQSVTNNGRDGATAVLRRVAESARDLPYRSLKQTNFASTIQGQAADLQSTSGGSWTVQRSGFTYTITASVCAVDDPGDGTNAHPAQDPPFCSAGAGTADDQPDDYRRVTTTVTWNVGDGSRSMTQVAVVGARGNQNLPAVTNVQGAAGAAASPVVPAVPLDPSSAQVTSIKFNVTTTNNPGSVSWTEDDDVRGSCPPVTTTCAGSGNAWNFTWSLGTPTLDLSSSSSPNYKKCIDGNYKYDGTYQLGARAFDGDGVAGPSYSIPYTLNRCAAIPPPNFNATGRNAATPIIDIEWTKNPEGDVVGYRVYKGTSLTSATQVCPAAAGSYIDQSQTSCVDTSPPSASGTYYYGAVAIDRDPSGNLREGALSYIPVNTGNRPPKAPINLAATSNADGTVTLTWALPASPVDPDDAAIESFRIYRRAASAIGSPTYLNRFDYEDLAALCVGNTCSYTDDQVGGVQHVYNVTSIDPHLAESPYTANLLK